MEVPSELLDEWIGQEVEIRVIGPQDRLIGVLDLVGPKSLKLQDKADEVWVNLSAVVSVRLRKRTPHE